MIYDQDFKLFEKLLDLIYEFNNSYNDLDISIKGDESNCNRLLIAVKNSSQAYKRFERLANRRKKDGKFEVQLDKGKQFICIFPEKDEKQ